MTVAVHALAAAVEARSVTVAVAESLTGGQLSEALAAAPGASAWFRGGVVAYAPEVKFAVLGVTPGPVVSARCAEEMADGARRLFDADVGVAVTGVGGPGPREGRPAGTVHLAVHAEADVLVQERHFEGDPPDVLQQTVRAAVELLLLAISRGESAGDPGSADSRG